MGRQRLTRTQEALRKRWEKAHPTRATEERELRKHNRAVRKRGQGAPVEATPQTLAHAATVQQGSLARLYEAGIITIGQLASGAGIAAVHERITSDVRIGTMSMETRVDESRIASGKFIEKLGAVRAEVAYSRWRRQARPLAASVTLAVAVENLSLKAADARFHKRKGSARRALSEGLDLWSDVIAEAVDEIDEATLLAAQSGLV